MEVIQKGVVRKRVADIEGRARGKVQRTVEEFFSSAREDTGGTLSGNKRRSVSDGPTQANKTRRAESASLALTIQTEVSYNVATQNITGIAEIEAVAEHRVDADSEVLADAAPRIMQMELSRGPKKRKRTGEPDSRGRGAIQSKGTELEIEQGGVPAATRRKKR